ncbi:hypothetical protein P8452_53274 [Trifolium repens]|nr:hypothetical protein P8452_53274 [Trifolium repens]
MTQQGSEGLKIPTLLKVSRKKKKSLFLPPPLNLLHTNPTIWSHVVCFLARREEGVLAKFDKDADGRINEEEIKDI